MLYDGNLPKLYKRVQKHLNLCLGQEGVANCLRQILSGSTSVVSGLSTLRTMSGSHVISNKPAEHHARLAVNTAKTLCDFLFETKEDQMRKHKGNVKYIKLHRTAGSDIGCVREVICRQ